MHSVAFRGKGGPLKTTVPEISTSLNNAFLKTLSNMGVPLLDNAYDGHVSYWLFLITCYYIASRSQAAGRLLPVLTVRPIGRARTPPLHTITRIWKTTSSRSE